MISPARAVAFALATAVCLAGNAPAVGAAPIYESATLGTTGQNGGASVSSGQFLAVRFELFDTYLTSSIGGHFGASGEIFGAVVALSGPTDFPDTANLSSADVLGAALLNPNSPSAEVFSPLTLTLTPGWYALVFGSGSFGATGSGWAPGNDQNIGTPSFFFRNSSGTWTNVSLRTRFVLDGNVAATPVPEPASMFLLGTGLVGLAARRYRQRRP